MYIISPSAEDISNGLESWNWLPIHDKSPIVVTAFGDVFFESSDGIWFLDCLEGTLKIIAKSKEELQKILNTVEGQDHYLMSGFVLRANDEGMKLETGQCYDFKIHPILGGPIEFENIEIQNFVVSLNIKGQIHEQIKDLPDGASINEIKVT